MSLLERKRNTPTRFFAEINGIYKLHRRELPLIVCQLIMEKVANFLLIKMLVLTLVRKLLNAVIEVLNKVKGLNWRYPKAPGWNIFLKIGEKESNCASMNWRTSKKSQNENLRANANWIGSKLLNQLPINRCTFSPLWVCVKVTIKFNPKTPTITYHFNNAMNPNKCFLS